MDLCPRRKTNEHDHAINRRRRLLCYSYRVRLRQNVPRRRRHRRRHPDCAPYVHLT